MKRADWIENLELLQLRIESGQHFSQALQGFAFPKAGSDASKLWNQISERILEGEISAGAALQSFLRRLRLQERVESMVEERSLGPRLQAGIITGLAVLIFLLNQFFFPDELRAAPREAVTAAVLLLGAHLWIKSLERSFRQRLWMADWLLYLENLASRLSWGHTLPSALKQSRLGSEIKGLPAALKKELQLASSALASGENHDVKISPGPFRKALEQLSHCLRVHERGEALSGLLHGFAEGSLESFERALKRDAEILSYKILAPLFLLCLPAFLLLLFGSLLRSLEGGGAAVY